MGRVKLKLERLENTISRQAMYAKRKHRILKNAKELSILCDIDIVLLMFSPTGRPQLEQGERRNFEEVIERFSQLTYCERMKRKLESLEALKRTFKKLDHNVNLDYFLGLSSQTTLMDLSNQLWELQAQLTRVHRRLSYWSNPNKIDNIAHLNQMENSLRESIKGILLQKENLAKHPPVATNYRGQNEMSLPLKMGGEQAQFPPWVANNQNQHMVQPSEKKPILHGGIECPAEASSPKCSSYFGTGYCKKMEVGDTGKLGDIGHGGSALNELSTYSGLSLELDKKCVHSSISTHFPSSMKLEPHEEKNLPVSPVAYQVNRNFGLPRSQYDEGCHASTSASGPSGSAEYNENAYQQQLK